MVACDDRVIFVTDLLHLFPKMACLVSKNAAACLAEGKGQEWEKCACMVHGKFLHCLQLQSHSKTVRSLSFLLRSGGESSYNLITGMAVTQKGAGEKYPSQRDQSAFNLESQKKNQISITVFKISKAATLN